MDVHEFVASLRSHHRCVYSRPMQLDDLNVLLKAITSTAKTTKHELYECVMKKHMDGALGVPELLLCIQYIDAQVFPQRHEPLPSH
jgi:DnaJ-domain-containing protein 1